MTFSITARCETTGQFGLAVSSSSPAVAARCAFARANVGAVSTQNITDPSLGEKGLSLLETGMSAQAALDHIVANTNHIQYRQLSIVDAMGETSCFSGEKTLGVHATSNEKNVACAGNLLSGTHIPEAMVKAFQASEGHLADRLLTAMKAAVNAGGEEGSIHSAGLLIVDKVSWPIVSLRVDWSETGVPINELEKLWEIYQPQCDDYVTRALDPSVAPSYGVPGDE